MSQISSDQNKDNLKSTDYFKSYLITPLFCTELVISGRLSYNLLRVDRNMMMNPVNIGTL